jgi:hypothetical protein
MKDLEQFAFIRMGDYKVQEIVDHVLKFGDEWFIDTSRQDTFVEHRHTNSYFIYEYPFQWGFKEPYQGTNVCKDPVLNELVAPIIKDLELKYNGQVGKALLIKLKAGEAIDPHIDGGQYLGFSRRNHIAIVTNPDVDFMVDGETKNMKVGECWQINNFKEHAVNNRSSQDRIHLLIDILPNEVLG